MKDYLKLGIVVALVVVFIAIVGAIIDRNIPRDNSQLKEKFGALHETTTDDSSFFYNATDLVGTKTGTSTVYVGFYGNLTATSSYVKRISSNYDTLSISLSGNASSTPIEAPGKFHFSIYGSNDDYCDTASSTTIYNTVTTNQINWYDIGGHVANLAGSQSLTGTSTIIWTMAGEQSRQGKELTFENINYDCIKLDANGSSTELFAQIRLK